MRRIALMVFRSFFKLPCYLYRVFRCAGSKKIGLEEAYFTIQKITKAANRAGRIKIECSGTENLPSEDGYIFFPNHQGLFDVLVFLETCPRPFGFVMKKEVRNIILVKQVGDALGALAIDREDIRQSMRVIQKMAEEVKKGKNFLIFPEGTRSKNGNHPGEFKAGSFKSAYKAKCPIVPCALIDSFKPFDEKSIQPVTVKLIYLPPIYYEEYCHMKTTEVALEVKRRIEEAIKSN